MSATAYTYTTTLTAGTLCNIELHFYEREGEATCRMHWSYPGQPEQAIPQSQLIAAAGRNGCLQQRCSERTLLRTSEEVFRSRP
jgi:hypothetical protein